MPSSLQNEIGGLNGVNSAGAILGCLTSAYTADKVCDQLPEVVTTR